METKRSKTILWGLVLIAAFSALSLGAESIAEATGQTLLMTVLKKGTVYALLAVSMNLLNGFTGLFSLGQAGFMLIGAYAYAILTIPVAKRAGVYQYYDGGIVQFSIPETFSGVFGDLAGGVIGMVVTLVICGLLAAFFGWLIGLPVLRLKSDYLAIATLGFAEVVRAVFQWGKLGPVTNGSNPLKSFVRINSFQLKLGGTTISLTTFVPVLLATVCIGLIVLLVNSTYGRSFKAIRDDEVAAEAMGINLARHKIMSFCISSFFAGVSGAGMAMVLGIAQASNFKSAMTYEILLIVVIGGIGSISGSCIATFLYIAASEWWLRGLDSGNFLGINAPGIFRNGFRLVVFSVIIMIVVLFFRKGIMGDRELPDLFKKRARKEGAGK